MPNLPPAASAHGAAGAPPSSRRSVCFPRRPILAILRRQVCENLVRETEHLQTTTGEVTLVSLEPPSGLACFRSRFSFWPRRASAP